MFKLKSINPLPNLIKQQLNVIVSVKPRISDLLLYCGISLVVVLPYLIPALQGKYFALGDSGLWFVGPFEYLKTSIFSWSTKINFGFDDQVGASFFYWQVLVILFSFVSLGKAAITFFLYKAFVILLGYWGFYKLLGNWQTFTYLRLILSFCFVYSIIPFVDIHLISVFSETVYYSLPFTVFVVSNYINSPNSVRKLILTVIVLSFDVVYLPNIAFSLGYIPPYLAVFIFLLVQNNNTWRSCLNAVMKLIFFVVLVNSWILYAYISALSSQYTSMTDAINPILNLLATLGYGAPYVGFTGTNLGILQRSGIGINNWIYRLATLQSISFIFIGSYLITTLKQTKKILALTLLVTALIAFVWNAGESFSLSGIIKSLATTPNIIVSIFRDPQSKIGPSWFISLILLVSLMHIKNRRWWGLVVLFSVSSLSIYGILVLDNANTFSRPDLAYTNSIANLSISPTYFELQAFLNSNIDKQKPILRLPLITFDYIQDNTGNGDYVGTDFYRYLYKQPMIFTSKYQQPTDGFVQNVNTNLLNGAFNNAFKDLLQHNVHYILIDDNIRINDFVTDKNAYAKAYSGIISELRNKSKKIFSSKDSSISVFEISDAYNSTLNVEQCMAANYSPKWHLFKWDFNYLKQNFAIKPYNHNGFTCFATPSIPGYVYFDDIVKIVLVIFSILVLILFLILQFMKSGFRKHKKAYSELLVADVPQHIA